MTEKKAELTISRLKIIRTWAATPTRRKDIPRIDEVECEKIVEWLDDALGLIAEMQESIENRNMIIKKLLKAEKEKSE